MVQEEIAPTPTIQVNVVEYGTRGRSGWRHCEIGTNIKFNMAKMESYFFAEWRSVLYDVLLVAAAVEFCDRTLRRPSTGWRRKITVRIPVHEPNLWGSAAVLNSLHDALGFLTGDRWEIAFYDCKKPVSIPRQGMFHIGPSASAVIPFSDGMDSRAVAGIMSKQLGDKLVRVRLGPKKFDRDQGSDSRQPFTSIPYEVKAGEKSFSESSARSRGFKFALLSLVAATLSRASRVIVPESGQGSIGAALIPVGQIYPDYRNHPLFTQRIEVFAKALLGSSPVFDFPQIWFTKGETLSRFVRECDEGSKAWPRTKSCWQQNRHSSVNHRNRQCGICAACMLRRLSIFAAGLQESSKTYIWENLAANTFDKGAASSFGKRKITRAMREYAIAGTLHLDHLAAVRHSPANAMALSLCASQTSKALGLAEADGKAKLDRLLVQHEYEWREFVSSLGKSSFVTAWSTAAR